MYTIEVRNVNDALDNLRRMLMRTTPWVKRETRGSVTLEWHEPVVTEYGRPMEKVLFNSARDANPFFHLFESIWILAGRNDLAFLSLFNRKISDYSDDGIVFHAPYGARMRSEFYHYGSDRPIDQILGVIELLKKDPDSRRAVISIWSPSLDLGANSKDIPCNDMVFFKRRDDKLDMTVCCRSNDALWGAYGANAVQFGTLLEFVAMALKVDIGVYRQVSDSFHVYPDTDTYRKIMSEKYDWLNNPYVPDYLDNPALDRVIKVPLLGPEDDPETFLAQCDTICEDILRQPFIVHDQYMSFFQRVVIPMWDAWHTYKTLGVRMAIDKLSNESKIDWLEAGARWLTRRVK